MVCTKFSCHFIISKIVKCGYRPIVQIVKKYSVLGIFKKFKLQQKLNLINFI